MKNPLRILLLITLFVSSSVMLFSQAPTVQDCLGAIPVCQAIYSTTQSYTGYGNVYPEIHSNSVCPLCMAGEINDVFYTFTVQSSGILRFTLTPNNPSNDYDWELFNMTNATCADLYTKATSLTVSCNSYGVIGINGPTGINSALSNNRNCNGPGNNNGPAFNEDLNVLQGETYLLNISNWSSTNQSGYTLDFTASTALIYDTIPPFIDSIQQTITCAGLSTLYVRFSENVLCSDIENHPEVFTLTAPVGNYTITGLSSPDCDVGGFQTTYCILHVSPPLSTRNYSLNVVGPIHDLCNNAMHYLSYPFPLTEINAPSANAGNDTTVNYGVFVTLHGTAAGGTAPLSWHWEPASMFINPNVEDPVTVNLTATTTFTLSVTDNLGCQAFSGITVTVVGSPLSMNTSATPDTICLGQISQLLANASGGNGNYTYTWSSNPPGFSSGIPNPTVSPVITTSYSVQINDGFNTVNGAMTVHVFPFDSVKLSIVASQLTVCAGTPVTFTANPTNPGTNPVYHWKVNGINSGANLPSYTYTPLNGDVITCTLTSSLTVCVIGNPVTSNPIAMTVNPVLPVSLSVAATQNPVCTGTLVTFTAIPVHPGTSPVYQWKVNGSDTGSNSTVFSYVPLNGDQVTCILTSSEPCASGNPASGNTITMTVNDILPVSITVTVSSNPVCAGTSVTSTALPMNGGTNPSFQWKVNGVNVGTNATSYTYTPVSGDQILCILNSNIPCPTGNPSTSNTIIMDVSALPVVTFTSCFDTLTSVNAKPIKLKGGVPLGGTYSGPGVNPVTGIFDPAAAGTGTKIITYTYTNVWTCTALAHAHIINQASPSFICGNPFTDIRDNQTYKTVKIGSQCWMASNLNYGTILASSQDQRDNCSPEKYCFSDNPVNCTNLGGLYQWDEIMQYDDTPSDQGLCPPGWHLPSENEWNTLFSYYISSGFAGNPLKYSGYSGFNALLSGVVYYNKSQNFKGFATFFWASTSAGSVKAWAHGMNDLDPSVSAYPSSRANAFSVRCVEN
jgi:uncharacterized protein (TIGR02145 family)